MDRRRRTLSFLVTLGAAFGLVGGCSLFANDNLSGSGEALNPGAESGVDGGPGGGPDAVSSGSDGSGSGDGETVLSEAGIEGGPHGDAGSYPAAVIADSPLLYLRLGEKSGLVAADSSGHGSDGAYLGAITQGLAGAIASDPDTAVRFGVVNWDAEKVRVIAPIDFPNVAPFSLEAWVKPESAVDGAYNAIIGRGGWSLFLQSEVVKFQRTDVDAGWDGPWFTTALSRDHFTHVVGTFDGTSMHLYIDGLDVAATPSTRAVTASPDPVIVGAHFPGSLDEVAVYDHALAPTRVKAHYKAATGQ